MDATVERYLLLGLRLGRHVDGLVDAYYGPPELKERVDAEEPIEASRLVADADALLAEVGDDWLGDQARFSSLAFSAFSPASSRLSATSSR